MEGGAKNNMVKKRIIIEVEPMEGTEDSWIKLHLPILLKRIEEWAKENFQNSPKVFLEELKEEKKDEP